MDLNIFPIDQKNINLISEAEARENNLVVLGRNSDEVRIGVMNPKENSVVDFLKKRRVN